MTVVVVRVIESAPEPPTIEAVIDELVALGNEVARAELRRQPFPPPEPGTS